MPTFQFEAMDATGQEIKDVIDAATEEEAQQTIRQMGYFVTKIAVKKQRGDQVTTLTANEESARARIQDADLVAVIQMPRPGSRRLRSGIAAPSGATTKRIISSTGLT